MGWTKRAYQRPTKCVTLTLRGPSKRFSQTALLKHCEIGQRSKNLSISAIFLSNLSICSPVHPLRHTDAQFRAYSEQQNRRLRPHNRYFPFMRPQPPVYILLIRSDCLVGPLGIILLAVKGKSMSVYHKVTAAQLQSRFWCQIYRADAVFLSVISLFCRLNIVFGGYRRKRSSRQIFLYLIYF